MATINGIPHIDPGECTTALGGTKLLELMPLLLPLPRKLPLTLPLPLLLLLPFTQPCDELAEVIRHKYKAAN